MGLLLIFALVLVIGSSVYLFYLNQQEKNFLLPVMRLLNLHRVILKYLLSQ